MKPVFLRESFIGLSPAKRAWKAGNFSGYDSGTKSDDVISALEKLPRSLCLKVKEITPDLSPTMRLTAGKVFPEAPLVADRSHVQRLMNEAVSGLGIDYRWQAIY
jgi:hypothetical protein